MEMWSLFGCTSQCCADFLFGCHVAHDRACLLIQLLEFVVPARLGLVIILSLSLLSEFLSTFTS